MTEQQQPDQQPIEDAAGGGGGADVEGGGAVGAGGVEGAESGEGASATAVDTASGGAAGPTVWRPYGYADSETGTAAATGAQLRHGPAIEGADVEDARTVNEELASRVLVPDDDATREAERHPNVAAPAAADVEGAGEGGADVEGGNDAT